jgi:hypothetical protein
LEDPGPLPRMLSPFQIQLKAKGSARARGFVRASRKSRASYSIWPFGVNRSAPVTFANMVTPAVTLAATFCTPLILKYSSWEWWSSFQTSHLPLVSRSITKYIRTNIQTNKRTNSPSKTRSKQNYQSNQNSSKERQLK